MAEHITTQDGIKKLQEEITCSICFDDLSDPKRLPCGHIYCKVPCLQGLLQQSMNSAVTCPECRSIAQIPANNLDNLPNAFHINRLKEVYSDLSTAIATQASLQGISHPCRDHSSQSQDLYCETCQELICRDCILVAHQHQEHKYCFIRDVAAEQKEAVLKELVPMKTFTQQTPHALVKIEEVKLRVVRQKVHLAQEIKASIDALHQVLEGKKQTLLVDLEKQTDLKLATIETQQQKIEAASGKLQQVVKFVHTATAHDDDGHLFFSKKRQLTAKLEDATSTLSQVSLKPAVEPDLVARVLSPKEFKQACASTDFYVHKGVPAPQRCLARGNGLKDTETNTSYIFTVHVENEHGIPCSGKVCVELKTLRDGAITKPRVTACSPSQYKVSYTPTVRGRHELSIKVNGKHITDSPFKVFVQIPVSKINGPVAEITDLVNPMGLHSTAERILACDCMGDQVAVYDYSLKRVATIKGGSHSTARKLKRPVAVTTDSQFNIYVTTYEDNSLHKFTKNGTHIKTVTDTERRAGQFNYPNGMCTFEDEFMYICDSRNNRVLVFDLNLRYLLQIKGHFSWPADIDEDTSGKVYVCNSEGGCIKVLAPDTHQHLYTINHQLSRPWSIKIFREALYVSDYNRNCVSAFTLSGEYIGSFGHEYLESPKGLTIDEDGFFYISSKHQNILVF